MNVGRVCDVLLPQASLWDWDCAVTPPPTWRENDEGARSTTEQHVLQAASLCEEPTRGEKPLWTPTCTQR